jgi:AcrR family transcriptional regulator
MGRLPAEKRKEQLLDTAAKLFATHGYAGATTSEIAKASGVTEPIIYRHFASKRDLFIALIERTGSQTLVLWEHELRTAPDPAERLRRLLHANPMVSSRGKGLYRVIIQAMTEVEDPEILAALHKHIDTLQEFLAKEVAHAQEAGTVSKRFSPEITAWALIHIGLGYGVLSALGVGKHGVDKGGMHIVDLLGELMLGQRYHKGDE